MIVCSKPSLPEKSGILRSHLMTFPGSFGIFGGVRLLYPKRPLLREKLPPLPPNTPCTPSLSALQGFPAAVVPAVSALSLIIWFSSSAATTCACRASSCFSSSSTLIAIPCCFPAPCRGTRYRVCGASARPLIVTRTALSWSGDKRGATQAPCYCRVKDTWAEPVGAPFRSVSMTEYPKQRRSSDRYFEYRCYILRL